MNKVKYEVVKFVNNNIEIDVNVSPTEETIWLNQDEISNLFGKAKSTINEHIKNILSNELNETEVSRKFGKTELSTIKTKPITYYNLDMILAIGYRVNSKQGIVFRKWANKVLKEYLLKGFVINENRVIVSNDNYIELKNEVVDIKKRLTHLEDKIDANDLYIYSILFNGQFYDAYTLLEQIFESADKEIILMDNYIDRTILDRLTSKKQNVKVTIYTSFNKSRITQNDIRAFNLQYPTITLIETQNLHDRYIIIDSTKLYHVGASIKDAGKKIFSIHELDPALITILLSKL